MSLVLNQRMKNYQFWRNYANGTATSGDIAMMAVMNRLLGALMAKEIFTRQQIDTVLHDANRDIEESLVENISADEWQVKRRAKELIASLAVEL